MKKCKLTILLVLVLYFAITSCSEECSLSPSLDLYEELWTVFNQEYAAFGVLNKDWDNIKIRHREELDENSDEKEIFDVFKDLLFELEDGHADLNTNSNLGSISYYADVINKTTRNYIDWGTIVGNYLEDITSVNGNLAFARIKGTQIGYLKIGTFVGTENDFEIAKLMFDKFDHLTGLIVDVRDNGGGNEKYAKQVANRLTDKKTTYRFTKTKEGCERGKISDFKKLELNPRGPENFIGPIVLLTNKSTFSSAENFTLMLKSLPNVIHVGDETFGGFASGPVVKHLSNGWRFRVSKTITYDLSKEAIVGGIIPDEEIEITANDQENKRDRIIERAIELLK